MMDLPGNAAIRSFMDQLSSSPNLSTKYGIELPMIAVMGDTSSGKSSLLSALSMVELPSNHQLTTKCPVLLKMTRNENGDDQKVAQVSIQWNNHLHTDDQPVFEQLEVTDMDELAQAITEAQEFILQQNPGKAVSSDTIHVHIRAPDCHDSTLVDLPGIVQSRATSESETMVEDVDELIKQYLENERCVILAVMPATVDFHNSVIMSQAQKVDPTTFRTFPVITKPDLIDEGAESDVLELLLGLKLEDFRLGFHMVKGRSQARLDGNQTLEESLVEEQEFFATQEPWSGVENRQLFGTANLRQKLGDLQIQMIRDCIPDVLAEVRARHEKAFDSLVKMGKMNQTTTEKRRFYQDLLQSYMTNLKSTLSGKGSRSSKKSSEPSAAAQLHDACAKFRDAIHEGSLATIKSVLAGSSVLVTTPSGEVRGEVVHVEDDFACVDYVDEKDQPTSEALFDYVGYKADEGLTEDDVWVDSSNGSKKVYIARSNNMFDLLKNIPLSRIRSDPAWLKEKIADNRTDDLACFLNVDIFKGIVADFIDEDWKPHCMALVDETSHIVMTAVEDSLEQTFGSMERFPKLKAMIRLHSERAARSLLRETRKHVNAHLEIEKHPYTQDGILMDNIAAARHRSLKRELEVALRLDQEGGVFDTAAIKAITDQVFERDRRKSVEEHMAEDMEIVLESYGRVATKRVIDRTPMLCWENFRSLATSVQDSLWNQITDKNLDEAMLDTPEIEAKHKELTEELEEMNKTLQVFQSLL